MVINLYIARPTYHFILIYTCGLTVVIKRICYVRALSPSFSSVLAKLTSARDNHVPLRFASSHQQIEDGATIVRTTDMICSPRCGITPNK